MPEFAGILFDAGGVLVLPDPTVLAPLLAYHGGDPSVDAHVRAHYAAMAAKSRAGSGEADWGEYDHAYVRSVGVPEDDIGDAAAMLARTRTAHLWRWPIPGAMATLRDLHDRGVPIGVVSNASGQIEEVLARSGVCQVGPGDGAPVLVVVDSHVVGIAKPDPRVFAPALEVLAATVPGLDPARVLYVGDSVTMDVAGARAAGLTPVLIDPFDDHADPAPATSALLAGVRRIRSLADLTAMVV